MSSASETSSSSLTSANLDETGDAHPSGNFSDVSSFFSSDLPSSSDEENLQDSDEEFSFAAPIFLNPLAPLAAGESSFHGDEIPTNEIDVFQQRGKLQQLSELKDRNLKILEGVSTSVSFATTNHILLKIEAQIIQHEIELEDDRGGFSLLSEIDQAKLLFERHCADQWPNINLSKEEKSSIVAYYKDNPDAQICYSRSETGHDQLICLGGIYFNARVLDMILYCQDRTPIEKARALVFSSLKKDAALFLAVGQENPTCAELNKSLIAVILSLVFPLGTSDRDRKVKKCLQIIQMAFEEIIFFCLDVTDGTM